VVSWLPNRDALSATASDVLKDGRKKVLYFVLALLTPYVLSAFKQYYDLDHVPDWPEVGRLLLQSLKNYPAFVHEWLFAKPTQFALQSPGYSILLLILFAGFVLLALFFIRAQRRLNLQSHILQTADISRSLIAQSGIKARYPHAKATEDGAPWGALRDEILQPENKFVHILGANGIDTFGKPGSPLFDTLKDFRGTTRVILCDPTGRQMYGRARAVGVSTAEYAKAIKISKRRLSELRKAQLAIEGRFYTGQPNWKLILTSTSAWIQYYVPGGPHVDQTAVWILSVTTNTDGLYHLFHMEFERVWERCKDSVMGLN
jgi:hypothetical protein